MTDRRVTERYIASTVGISQERVHSILTEDLEMRKLSARWVPRLLTVDQKHTRRTLSHTNLNLFEEDPVNFLKRFVNMDETWVHQFTPEAKQESKQWKAPRLIPPKKAKTFHQLGRLWPRFSGMQMVFCRQIISKEDKRSMAHTMLHF